MMHGNGIMKRALARLLLLLCAAAAHAEGSGWNFGVGMEHYQWKEYPIGTTIVPAENGDRLALFLGWKPDVAQGTPYVSYVAKIYGGTVNYHTATMISNIPVQTTTDYLGMTNEARGFIPATQSLAVVIGLGYDYWRRAFADSSAGTGIIVQGYSENWSSLFLRLGASFDVANGVIIAGGLKHTLQNTIETGFFGTLHPSSSTTPYLEGSYQVDQHASVALYYDSYRFAQSAVNAQSFYQPKSNMDTLGVKLTLAY